MRFYGPPGGLVEYAINPDPLGDASDTGVSDIGGRGEGCEQSEQQDAVRHGSLGSRDETLYLAAVNT